MLFTDRMFCDADSLSFIDGEIVTVAQTEGIIIDSTPQSVVWHYTLAAGEKLLSHFQNFSGYLVGIGADANHAAAVMNILSTAIQRPRAMLPQIVVAEPDPTRRALARWVRYSLLHDFYRNAARRKVNKNDRYRDKMVMYGEERDEHWSQLQGRGVPVILTPLAAPGAIWLPGSGSWGPGNVAAVSGGSLATQTAYQVSITWCSLPTYSSYTAQNGAESAGSVPQPVSCPPDTVIQVTLAGLNPPTTTLPNSLGTADGIFPPMNATHWNVYVGAPNGPLCLQNSSPIPIGTTIYTLAGAPVANGSILNDGQPASYNFTVPDGICWRA